PFLMMLYASLLPFYQVPSAAAFASMSLGNYWSLFHNSKTVVPMINSTILGPATATAVVLVPLPIIGTLTIIGLAYLTKYMPVALRFVSASMMQIHSELDEAAQVAG